MIDAELAIVNTKLTKAAIKLQIQSFLVEINERVKEKPVSYQYRTDFDSNTITISFNFNQQAVLDSACLDYKSCIRSYLEGFPVFKLKCVTYSSAVVTTGTARDLVDLAAVEKASESVQLEENLGGLPDEIWIMILSRLCKIDLLRLALVSRNFNRLSTDATLWTFSASITSKGDFISYFSRIPYAFRGHLMSLSMLQLQKAFDLLNMNLAARKKYFASEQPLNQAIQDKLFSNEGCILLLSGELSLQDAIEVPSLLTPIGISALKEGLITVESARLFRHTGHGRQCTNLNHLLCPNGLKMLREKLIFPESACQISGLAVLLSDDGVYMLENGLITPSQASAFYHSGSSGHCSNLSALVNKQGIKALEERLITVEEIYSVSEPSVLLSDLGLYALEKKLITVKDAARFHHNGSAGHCTDLRAVICENGIKALEEGLLTIDQMYQISCLNVLTKDNVPYLEYLRQGSVSFEELKENGNHHPVTFEKFLKETVAKRKVVTLEERKCSKVNIP